MFWQMFTTVFSTMCVIAVIAAIQYRRRFRNAARDADSTSQEDLYRLSSDRSFLSDRIADLTDKTDTLNEKTDRLAETTSRIERILKQCTL